MAAHTGWSRLILLADDDAHKRDRGTDDYIYDFNNPNRDDVGRFMNEAIAAKEYVRKQIRGKMLKNRTRKANMGLVANGMAPIGLMLDESRNNLVPSPHAVRVNWLYGRYRALDANLGALLQEVLNMAKRGEPLFPDVPGWTPDRIQSKRIGGGWTVSTRFGLIYILTNPMYVGHLLWDGLIVKRNAHQAIVDEDLWNYAFTHLYDVDLDGQPIERDTKAVRYRQKKSVDIGALLAGTRDSGKLTIDGVNGAHVYIQITSRTYQIIRRGGLTVSGYETAIQTKDLDRILEDRLLHWLCATDRQQAYNQEHGIASPYETTPFQAMGKLEQVTQPTTTNTVQDDLTLTNKEIARIEHRLRTSEDVMSDEDVREAYASKATGSKRKMTLKVRLVSGLSGHWRKGVASFGW